MQFIFLNFNWPNGKTLNCIFGYFYVAQLAMLRRKRFLISCMKLGKGQFTFLAVPILLHFCWKIRHGANSVLPIRAHPHPWNVKCHGSERSCLIWPKPSLCAVCLLTVFFHICLAIVKWDFLKKFFTLTLIGIYLLP